MTNTDDQNLTIIGEGLIQLNEDNFPKKKPASIEDQYALDAQGRRRFHGAFTGGFSAGYFNSVDTRDGWRPHQFVSSRTKKAGRLCQRPEDFMDDEDTGEHGIGSVAIRTSNNFANHTGGGIKRKRANTDNGPIPGSPVLRDLLMFVTRDTVGVRLLKKMGWKPGQGVGPRLTKTERIINSHKRTSRKIYGCSLPNKGSEASVDHPSTSNEDVEMNREMLFAPDDLEPLRCKPKDNYSGIGYSGLNKMSMIYGEPNLVDSSVFQMHDKNKKFSIKGQAFGVGAFEADDADIYQCDDMSHYDFVLDSEEKRSNLRSNQKISELRRCSCLEGFIIAESRLEEEKLFSPPGGLENFVPIHVIKQSRFSAAIHETEISKECGSKNPSIYIHDAHNRRKILDNSNSSANTNECIQTHHKLKLLFKENSNIENVSQCSMNLQILGSVVERNVGANRPTIETQESIPTSSWMNKLITRSFVRGMKQNLNNIQNSVAPFVYDINQQKPFKISTQSSENNEGEKHELIESLPVEDSTPAIELIKPTDISLCSTTRTGSKITILNTTGDNFAKNAAKINAFGKMTRTLNIWQPVSALCKRFNISELESDCAQLDTKKAKSHRLFEFVDFRNETNTSDTKSQKADETSTYGQSNVSDKKCNYKFTDVENVTKFSEASSIFSHFCDKSQLGSFYKKIHTTSVGNDFESKRVEEEYYERNSTENQTKTEVIIDDENSSKSFMHSPCLIQKDSNTEAKCDLFKEIFLSCSESSESDNESTEGIYSSTVDSLVGKHALNAHRNTSPARGIFAQLNLNESTGLVNPTKVQLQHSSCLQIDVSDTNMSKEKDSKIGDFTECRMEGSSDIYGPALPTKFFNAADLLSYHPGHLNEVALKQGVVKKLGLPGRSSQWVEKSKVKKSKKTKKKQKNKRKNRKHKYISDRIKIE